MTLATTTTILIFTLLLRCNAEISNQQPEAWYSANVINDPGFLPKPLSEIFPTDKSFSTVNPIVVLSSTSETIPSPVKQESASALPIPAVSTSTSTVSPTTNLAPSTTPTTSSTTSQTTLSVSTLPPTTTTVAQTRPTPPPQLPSQDQQMQSQSILQTGAGPSNGNPNYFFVYQQAPQSVIPPFPTLNTAQPFNPQGSQFNQNPPFADLNSEQPLVNTQGSPPCGSFTCEPPVQTTVQTPVQNTVQPTLPSSPSTNGSVPALPFIRIRMQSPAGSITNVNVNPPSSTRRPTTTRRNRRRNNNYDDCISACGSRRTPICATPLATRPINPDNLKGFPSICHMACHNSFRKNLYEKAIDGRCGRLRTRIRTVDSNNKLTRNQLNRVQYTVVQNPSTVIEFTPLA